MHIHTSTPQREHVQTHIHAHMHTHTCTHTHIHTYAHIHSHALRADVCAHALPHTLPHTQPHTHTRTQALSALWTLPSLPHRTSLMHTRHSYRCSLLSCAPAAVPASTWRLHSVGRATSDPKYCTSLVRAIAVMPWREVNVVSSVKLTTPPYAFPITVHRTPRPSLVGWIIGGGRLATRPSSHKWPL